MDIVIELKNSALLLILAISSMTSGRYFMMKLFGITGLSRRLSCPVFLFLCLGLPLSSASISAETFRVATGEWVPYVSESYKHNGAIGHIIEKIFESEGVKVEFGYFPWARGYQMVKDSVWDTTMPYYCSPEREKLFYCSDPIAAGQQVFFHLVKKPFDWASMSDIKGLKVGTTLGYFYGAAFEKAEKDKQFIVRRIASDETNFQLLMRGVLDLF